MADLAGTYLDTETEENVAYVDHDLSAKRDACAGKISVPADSTTAVHLIQRVGNQDREAFSQLYDRFSTLVFTLAMRMLKIRSDAEDLLQEVFVQVWRQAQGYSAERAVRKHGLSILRAAGQSTKYVLCVEWKRASC